MSDALRIAVPRQVYAMDIRRHQIVEASAGTGKTFLLEHRVVDLVLRHGASIEDILVVTFTEKATAELRSRIRGKLHELLACSESTAREDEPHWQMDEAARGRLRAAIEAFDRTTISTIHAFCHRVLADGAFAAGRLLHQEQVSAESAFADALDRCLREELAVDPDLLPYLRAWLEGGTNRVASLRQLLFEVHQRGGDIVPALDERRLEAALQEAEERLAGADLEAAFASVSPAATRKAMLRRMELLQRVVSVWRERGIPATLPMLAETSTRLDYLEGRKIPESCRSLVDAALAVEAARVSPEAAIASLFYPRVRDRGQLDKQRRGHFDFDDMLNLLWEALEGARGERLASALRSRYPYALIDEFQDTDPVQWQIFRRIYLEADSPARLTLVGDPKQAIYSFRGADLHTYLQARDEVVRGGGQLTDLATNYRSTPAMVAACNRLFTGDPPYFSGGVEYRSPAAAGTKIRATDGRGRPIAAICMWSLGDGEASAADLRKARLEGAIVAEIEAILFDPARAIRVGLPGEEKPVRAGDIFVLTRSLQDSRDIAEALRRRGIPSSLFKQEGLLQSREAQEVRDLLVAIARPHSAAARLRAWQTRFFGLSLTELERTRDLEDTHPLVARLHDWHEIAQRNDVHRLFSAIIDGSRIVERELVLAHDRRALTNVQHIFDLLAHEASRSRCDIHQLAERLQHWMDTIVGIDSEGKNVQRPEADDQAVQVMTIHKSKGLENKVVFLCGGWSSSRPERVRTFHRDGRRMAWVGSMTDGVKEQVQRETRAEDERLYYVALTRAVARMYLPRSEAPKLRGPYAAINERLSPALEDGELFELAPLPRSSEPRAVTRPLPPLRPAVATGAGDLEALYRGRLGPGVTSYSQLSGDHRAAQSAGGEAPATAAAEDALPGGRHLGIALHEVLERIPYAIAAELSLDDWRTDPRVRVEFDRALSRLGLNDGQRRRAESAVYSSLRAPLPLGDSEMPGVAAAALEVRELEFLFSAGPGRSMVKGFIDLVFQWHERYYVLDWKSDHLEDYGKDALRAHVEAQYATQASLYAQALRMHLLPGPAGSDAAAVAPSVAGSSRDDRGFGGVVYLFLRAAAPLFIAGTDPMLRFDPERLGGDPQ